MSDFRDLLNKTLAKPIYVKPNVLPQDVAFTVIKVANIDNKTTGKKSNVMHLKYKNNLYLQFYGDQDFQELSVNHIEQFQAAITKGELFYLVNHGKIGDYYVTKIRSSEQINELTNIMKFDENLHDLIDLPKNESSPLKRVRTD